MEIDRFTSGIIQDALQAVGDEMFEALRRTSMSPIIYEALDFAVGATDAQGNLLAQGNGVTAFLGSLDSAVRGALEHYDGGAGLSPGDIVLTNSPYQGGGTHLPDVVTILPIFHDGSIVAFTVNKAHWTEIGGMDTGSLTTRSTEIFQEGLHFRFLKLYEAGKLNTSLVELIRENVRLPDDTLGDMYAGVAAARVGARRIESLIGKYGRDAVLAAMEDLLDYGERMTRLELLKLPEGVYTAEDVIEEDGLGNGPFTIKVAVTLKDGRCIADFTGTAAQAPGPVNCSYAGLLTGVRCVFKAVTNPDIPANGGAFRPLEIICPSRTLLTAESPAPVSLYFESLIAAIDVVWKALAPIAPNRLPAGHKRTVGSTFISGFHPDTGELYIMGEPLMGGWGAAPDADGINGMFCCGNGETFNIPVELTEARYGLQVDQYAFHTEPGGEGKFRGGKGVVLDYRVTCGDAFLTVAFSRTLSRPWGLQGGGEGSLNYAEILRADGSVERHSVGTAITMGENEVARLYSATGGGFGDPAERPADEVHRDLRNGYITPEQAACHYPQATGREPT